MNYPKGRDTTKARHPAGCRASSSTRLPDATSAIPVRQMLWSSLVAGQRAMVGDPRDARRDRVLPRGLERRRQRGAKLVRHGVGHQQVVHLPELLVLDARRIHQLQPTLFSGVVVEFHLLPLL